MDVLNNISQQVLYFKDGHLYNLHACVEINSANIRLVTRPNPASKLTTALDETARPALQVLPSPHLGRGSFCLFYCYNSISLWLYTYTFTPISPSMCMTIFLSDVTKCGVRSVHYNFVYICLAVWIYCVRV